jgi:hypothetical protein
MKKGIFTFLTFLMSVAIYGQEFKVIEELTLRGMDTYARTHQVFVGEGDERQLCAVIKVSLILPEVKFGGNFFKQQSEGKNGEYIVYVAPGCKKLKVMSDSFIPLEYLFPSPVESGRTYQLVLGLPESSESLVRIRVNVKNAVFDIGGQHFETDNGHFEIRIPKGKYEYHVSTNAPGFNDLTDEIEIDDIFKQVSVNLTTTKIFKLTVNADDDSRITIDGEEQKKRGSQILDVPAGLHTIEAFMGIDERWTKRVTVDMTKENAKADMTIRGNLRIIYPSNSEFEIIPVNNALLPSKKSIKTGEVISLLGDYNIKVKKKNYSEAIAFVSINPNTEVDNFKITVSSIGDNYFYGINGEKQDYKKAFKEYLKMAKKGDDIAQFKLAYCYDNGYGTFRDLAQAKSYYLLASNAGHSEASYALATLISDKRERAECYIKAANQGNVPSMKIAGDFFMQKKDYMNARKYYLMAIKANNPRTSESITQAQSDSFYALGEIYYQGLGVTTNYDQAKDYFTNAAGFDNSNAIERLIDYIYFGYNGKSNQALAISNYAKLGDGMSNTAKLRVALYEYERQSYETANTYFLKLIGTDVDYPKEIGEIFYIMGDKTYKKDTSASFYYYSTALNKGCVKPKQLVRLGYMYMNAKGTNMDYYKALECFDKASRLNDPEATCMLGYLYEKGRGVPAADINKAIELYLKSAKGGFIKAYTNLGTLYAGMKDMDKAAYYWEFAGNAGNKTAISNLIKYYGNRKNKEKEEYWTNQLKIQLKEK